LAAGAATDADWQYLASRRLALFIVNCIERGTRWAAGACRPRIENCAAAEVQVRAFLESLHGLQAFGERRPQDAFFVACEQRSELQIVVGFAASRHLKFHTFRIQHSASGSRVWPIRLHRSNDAQFSPAELEWVEDLARSLSP
ncbi:MAG: hypothetical protein WA803_12530, partial [Steroidobacteraceae bacterium]